MNEFDKLSLEELKRELRDIESRIPIFEHKKRQSLLDAIQRKESDAARLQVLRSMKDAGIIEEDDDEFI
tara:strand:- start:1376 stop:1582 length:207 start_codon:yes stop_codon:yes gene_type:complete